MPRRARLAIPGIPWHIIKRGNKRSACFYAEEDYRRYRSGTLWEGRFRSCLARDEEYVLGCYRYIELNPVRAAMVAHLGDYKWPSYRANGEGQPDLLLSPHADYLRLASTEESRRESYRALFKAHLESELLTEIRTATNGNFVLGSERFKEEVAQMLSAEWWRESQGARRQGEDSAWDRAPKQWARGYLPECRGSRVRRTAVYDFAVGVRFASSIGV